MLQLINSALVGEGMAPNLSNEKLPLFKFIIDSDLSFSLDINGIIVAGIVIFFLIVLLIRLKGSFFNDALELDEAAFGIGSQKIKLKPNVTDSQIAYKIWVELSTRKIGLEVDLDNDVVVEIYDSWYSFFSVTRELIKEVPVSKLKRKETRQIVSLSIKVLNKGVRPHLTSWQARFRRWYENELNDPEKANMSPQELQIDYPKFEELKDDLISVNKKLILYRKAMYKLAVGEK